MHLVLLDGSTKVPGGQAWQVKGNEREDCLWLGSAHLHVDLLLGSTTVPEGQASHVNGKDKELCL